MSWKFTLFFWYELNDGDSNIILDWDQSISKSTDTFFFLQYSKQYITGFRKFLNSKGASSINKFFQSWINGKFEGRLLPPFDDTLSQKTTYYTSETESQQIIYREMTPRFSLENDYLFSDFRVNKTTMSSDQKFIEEYQ